MKSARDYWIDKFDELPQNDAEKLAVTMMAEYANYVSSQLEPQVMQKIEEDFENKFIHKYILSKDGWAWKNKDMHYNEIVEFIKTKLKEVSNFSV